MEYLLHKYNTYSELLLLLNAHYLIHYLSKLKKRNCGSMTYSYKEIKNKLDRNLCVRFDCPLQRLCTPNFKKENCKILVTDDDPFNHLLIEKILNLNGFKVENCENGEAWNDFIF